MFYGNYFANIVTSHLVFVVTISEVGVRDILFTISVEYWMPLSVVGLSQFKSIFLCYFATMLFVYPYIPHICS